MISNDEINNTLKLTEFTEIDNKLYGGISYNNYATSSNIDKIIGFKTEYISLSCNQDINVWGFNNLLDFKEGKFISFQKKVIKIEDYN